MSRVVDTLALARRKHPAGPNSLDALCKRYCVDTSRRTKHGALIDCLLLAEVYVELLGERQAALGLQSRSAPASGSKNMRTVKTGAIQRPQPLPARIDAASHALHRTFIEELGAKAVWLKYWPSPPK
jgi:DNA polymerase-3 subunit epsilon